MSFNLLGAIGGAVGGFFTGGPVGAAVGGVEGGLSGSAPAGPAPGANPLLPMMPPAPDTITSLLGQGQPIEDMSSSLAPSSIGDASAGAADAMASIADFS
ncbi:MAG TPA: hypothetical protein VN603_08920 [Candidatus Acidoferrales bacterium]|jgi:hypothetical protein|nr:hypothetical protein [Candidatus Acidoferrales bacterium]